MSGLYDALQRLEAERPTHPERERVIGSDPAPSRRPCNVVCVCSSKGGVGKTTFATNLAVYMRAIDEDRPVLLLNLDDQSTSDRMFAMPRGRLGRTMTSVLRSGDLRPAIQLGQYGVHYVATGPDIGDAKRELRDPKFLGRMIERSGWEGLVIVDTKGDLEILTQGALAACDFAIVLVRDYASLLEARRVFSLLQSWGRPREATSVLLSMIDLRVKFTGESKTDLLSLLVAGVHKEGWPLLPTFLSSTPKIEQLYTNPEEMARTILHSANGSIVHRQMHRLATEISTRLEELPARRMAARPAQPASGLDDLPPDLVRPPQMAKASPFKRWLLQGRNTS